MHKPRTALPALFIAISITIAALSGCATDLSSMTAKSAPFDMQKRAVERSAARWKALTDKRFNEAFNFLSDASKVGTTASEYGAAMQRMGYLTATAESATCEDSVCTVKSTITLPVYIRNVGARPQTLPIEERWIANNGELWLIRR